MAKSEGHSFWRRAWDQVGIQPAVGVVVLGALFAVYGEITAAINDLTNTKQEVADHKNESAPHSATSALTSQVAALTGQVTLLVGLIRAQSEAVLRENKKQTEIMQDIKNKPLK